MNEQEEQNQKNRTEQFYILHEIIRGALFAACQTCPARNSATGCKTTKCVYQNTLRYFDHEVKLFKKFRRYGAINETH